MEEMKLQAAFWKWAWVTYPQFRRLMWAVPNGLKLNPVQASIAVSTGMLAGVWDLHCFYRGQYHIIEAKTATGKLTEDKIVKGKKIYGQKQWGELMQSNGARLHIFRTLEEGQEIYRDIFCVR